MAGPAQGPPPEDCPFPPLPPPPLPSFLACLACSFPAGRITTGREIGRWAAAAPGQRKHKQVSQGKKPDKQKKGCHTPPKTTHTEQWTMDSKAGDSDLLLLLSPMRRSALFEDLCTNELRQRSACLEYPLPCPFSALHVHSIPPILHVRCYYRFRLWIRFNHSG